MSLPDRDPSVRVDLTPDAERITAACEALVLDYRPPKDRDDDDGLRQVLARLFRTRAESGQLKHGPMEIATEFRNPYRQKRQEAMDGIWYDFMGEALVDYLFADRDRLRARIADLERERDRSRVVGDALADRLALLRRESWPVSVADMVLVERWKEVRDV